MDGTDASAFKKDFGRSKILNPCNRTNPCKGDFDCDGDVDGTDASVFKLDFGRSIIINPCPTGVDIKCNYDCGNGVCDTGENSTNCVQDCWFKTQSCTENSTYWYRCSNGELVDWCKCVSSRWVCDPVPESKCCISSGQYCVNCAPSKCCSGKFIIEKNNDYGIDIIKCA